MKNNFKNLLIIFVIIFCIFPIFLYAASNQNATLILKQNKIGLNETIELDFQTNNMDAQNLKINVVENFSIASQSTSNSISIINSQTTNKKTQIFILKPNKIGKFTLTATYNFNGKQATTNSVQIEVTKAVKNPKNYQAASNNNNNPFANLPSFNAGISQPQNTPINKNYLFAKSQLLTKPNTNVYLGQKICLDVSLYTKYQLLKIGISSLNFNNFTTETLSSKNIKKTVVKESGGNLLRYGIAKVALSPLKTGLINIMPIKMQVLLNAGASFFNDGVLKNLATNQQSLKILPLPTKGKPIDFSGVVGSLSLSSFISAKTMNVNDELTEKIIISGSCNLDSFSKFNITSPNFTIYQNVKKVESKILNNRYFTQKEIDVILIPNNPGKLKTPVISLNYFNPKTQKYEQKNVASCNILVTGQKKENLNNLSTNTINISQINNDATKKNVVKKGDQEDFVIKINKKKFSIVIILLFLICGAIIYKKRILKKEKKKNIKKIYLKKLNHIKNLDNMLKLVEKYLKDKYNFDIKKDRLKNLDNIIEKKDELVFIKNFFEDNIYKKYADSSVKVDLNMIVKNFKKVL